MVISESTWRTRRLCGASGYDTQPDGYGAFVHKLPVQSTTPPSHPVNLIICSLAIDRWFPQFRPKPLMHTFSLRHRKIHNGGNMFSGMPSVRTLFVNTCCAWRDICAFSERIWMKLGMNIHHVSGHCWKGFKIRGLVYITSRWCIIDCSWYMHYFCFFCLFISMS